MINSFASKLYVCLVAIALPIAAAPVTITGIIRKADNTLATGIATIELTSPCLNASGNLILDRPLRVPFNNGALSVQLEPTTVCPIQPFYRVRYQVDRVWISAYEYWAVEPTPTTTTIEAVRRQDAAPPAFALATAKGDLGVWTGTKWEKLARGPDGQVLKANSATATGLEWGVGGGGSGVGSWTSPSLNFGTIIDVACATDLSFTAAGLTVGTPLIVVPYSGIGSVRLFAWATAADTAKIRVCNTSGSDVAVSGVFTIRAVAGYLSASATLDFPSIIAGGYAPLTLTVTGATAAMGALVAPPAGLAAGIDLSARVTAPNVVTITAHNLSDSDIDPAAGVFTGVVIQ